MGLSASGLAGLHVHFLLATALHAQVGDVGSFITSSEWLDTDYDRLVRDLLTGPALGVKHPRPGPEEPALRRRYRHRGHHVLRGRRKHL